MILLLPSSQIPVPPKKGGAIEKLVYGISKIDGVYVVACCGEGKKLVKVGSLKLPWPFSIFYEVYWGFKVFFKAITMRPKAIHFNTPFNAIVFYMFRALGMARNIKSIYTSHNPSWTADFSSLSLFNKIILLLEMLLMKRSDFVTAVSKEMKKGYEKFGVYGSIVIYNFVNDSFRPKERSWKKKLGIGRNKMLLFVGKLTETKGFPLLIEAMKSIDAMLVVVGGSYYGNADNPFEDKINKFGVREKVIFLGSVDEEELPYIYSAADALVFPSRREAFGLVAAEAVCCGTTVVSSNLPVMREVLGNDAYFFKNGSVDDMRKKIIKALKNPKKGRCRFRMKRILRQWKRFYREVLNGS